MYVLITFQQALFVFEFHEKLPLPKLADVLHALRTVARKETKDLMWKGEHMGYYVVFLDRIEQPAEVALKLFGKEAEVAMDFEPPPKRQHVPSVLTWL